MAENCAIVSLDARYAVFVLCLSGIVVLVYTLMLLKKNRTISRLDAELRGRTADLEEEVGRARAAAKAKSDFLSRMSHEIRTPLNAIIGMAQIARSASTVEKIRACMEKMEDNSRHLLGVVNDILDFSKIESGKMVLEEKPFSLVRDVDFVSSMFKTKVAEKNIELRVTIGEIAHDGIVTDMLRLNQVLINLLSNAVKFTNDGGLVELAVDELVHVNGESVYSFSVRDSGVGIDPEGAKKLFTPFTQANTAVSRVYGGTGLGLAISQNIVQLMGGNIELETEVGKGSEFRFTIRAAAQEAAEAERERDSAPALSERLRGKRILLVDDVEINREIVIALLDGSGLLIETASDGREALDAFCNADPGYYDLMLMDMLMPVMDGCDAARRIRGSGKPDADDIRIVAMTANVLPEDVDRAYKSGMNAYLTKPIDAEELYAYMEEWL